MIEGCWSRPARWEAEGTEVRGTKPEDRGETGSQNAAHVPGGLLDDLDGVMRTRSAPGIRAAEGRLGGILAEWRGRETD